MDASRHIETASHILRDCETLTTLRYRHLCHHFLKPGDFEDISVSRILHFVQVVGLLNAWAKGLHKRLITVGVHGSLQFLPPLFYMMAICAPKMTWKEAFRVQCFAFFLSAVLCLRCRSIFQQYRKCRYNVTLRYVQIFAFRILLQQSYWTVHWSHNFLLFFTAVHI